MRAILLAPLLLAAACSSGTSSSSSDQGIVSASATAAKIGCVSYAPDAASGRELFVADSGTCTVNGTSVTVYRFSNNASRDNWIKAASSFGAGRYVVIDRGVVTSDDQALADMVKAKIGGEIRS